ncbi:DUF202 domain-containing protein [Vibrio sinaloensis]|uniref:DUF202 domain-containing protein n=1 Tax=Photobacterium sp. (strain ATCC 43367) TaxID=379097 RepID=A0A0A5HXV3_PHOS4|nr:DUF202 domain-containing protein [Vibrio sinaloensis]KGY08361.1 hypothetical protein NM06_12945 [Vibrio sinaloensis]
MNAQPIVRDQGLQRERTQLAWTRSALVVTTGFMLLIKVGTLSMLGYLLLLAALWLSLNKMMKRRSELATQPDVLQRGMLARNAWLTCTVSLAALWVCWHSLMI